MSDPTPAPKKGRSSAARRVRDIDPLQQPAYLQPVVEPTPGRRIGRVFGYLGLTVAWVGLLGVVLFVTVAAIPGGISGIDIGTSPAVTGADAWIGVIAMPLLVAPVLGFATVTLVLMSGGMLLSAATLFARSLNPAYRNEQLSVSLESRRGEAAGPVSTAFTGVAMSQVPMRLTRWSKIVVIIQFNGWVLNAGTLVIGTVYGLLYCFTVVWVLWPATGAAVPICMVITVLSAMWLVFTIWRRRAKFPTVMPVGLRGTVYECSWPNRPTPQKKKPTYA